MAGGITLLAAERVAPPLLRDGLWPVHPFAGTPLLTLGDQLVGAETVALLSEKLQASATRRITGY